MGWTAWGSNFGRNKRFFPSPKHPTPTLRYTPSLIINGFQDSFPGVMRPRRDIDHSLPSTTEVRNEWRHTSTSFILPSHNAHRQLYLCGLPPISTTYFE